ncbi:MAG TPA: hypothetical protein VNH11_20460 [Pirellulales bacterium]|nr:hypothetical protein [Pirellulales bacterium]
MSLDHLPDTGHVPFAGPGQSADVERRQEHARRGAWNDVIDRVLVEWRLHPERLEDDGIDSPTPAAIAGASRTACQLRDDGSPLPTNIAPTGDGGVALHYEHKDVLLTIEVDAAGKREVRFFFEGELVRLSDAQPS